MAKKNSIKLFEDKLVRSVWDEEKEEWFFAVNDVVQILTDSTNVTDYIKKMRKRDEELGKGWGQIVTPLSVQTAGGKQKTNFANTQGLFRIIQSIPSKKAEPFKQWLAKVGAERLDQLQDPELSIKQGLEDYRRLGYSDDWINQRLKSIEIRKDLTDQWKEHNVEEGVQYAALTDIIYQAWAGKTGRSIVTPLNARDYFEAQIESKKEQLYLPVRNFILGTGLSFGFSNEKLRVPYKDSYFVIDQLYYHIPTRRNVLLKILRKNLTQKEKEEFKEQIQFFNRKDKREGENNAVGLLFIISEKQVSIDYVLPEENCKSAGELGLPSPEVFDSYLQKSLADLRMN
ncbi:MAG: DUF1016 family protein [Treponema sp.]|uniref:Bro-N domain-containing protein n=1 Tax=Treponema sp. TaxID=166 RepID=UPI0025EF65A9|nr:Bro-N domain-containing protein [Treponema sp.]MBQ9280895.1 DUF1016 family protein [Treponema sp.]